MTVRSTPIDPEALAIPASYVNKFQISILDGTLVRLSFAEVLGSSPVRYRAAMMMNEANAKQLALAILTMLGTGSQTPS